jgi:hypothetical protein
LKLKFISKINKSFYEKENHSQRGSLWQHDIIGGSGLLTSAVGPADVSVDQVNIGR